MVFKGLIAAAAAAALAVTPTLAAAQSSAAVARAAAAQAAPAEENVDGESEMFGRGGFIIPLIAIILIGLGIYIALDDKDDDLPASP